MPRLEAPHRRAPGAPAFWPANLTTEVTVTRLAGQNSLLKNTPILQRKNVIKEE